MQDKPSAERMAPKRFVFFRAAGPRVFRFQANVGNKICHWNGRCCVRREKTNDASPPLSRFCSSADSQGQNNCLFLERTTERKNGGKTSVWVRNTGAREEQTWVIER